MAHLEENKFSSYLLDDEETRQGSMLTVTQRQVMQNNLVACSEELLTLATEVDLSNPASMVQAMAYQQGMIAAYQFIIDASDATSSQQVQEGLASISGQVEGAYVNSFVDPNIPV